MRRAVAPSFVINHRWRRLVLHEELASFVTSLAVPWCGNERKTGKTGQSLPRAVFSCGCRSALELCWYEYLRRSCFTPRLLHSVHCLEEYETITQFLVSVNDGTWRTLSSQDKYLAWYLS